MIPRDTVLAALSESRTLKEAAAKLHMSYNALQARVKRWIRKGDYPCKCVLLKSEHPGKD